MLCDNLKLLYLKPPKTATTSISQALATAELNLKDDIIDVSDLIPKKMYHVLPWRHVPWAKQPNSYKFHNYTHVISVRNPYDRVISEFKYQLKEMVTLRGLFRLDVPPINPAYTYDAYLREPAYQLKDINLAVKDGSVFRNATNLHNFPLVDYYSFYPGSFIIRYEHLNEDWDNFRELQSFPIPPLKQINDTNSITSEKFVLDEESKNIIYEMYMDDFITFNYEK